MVTVRFFMKLLFFVGVFSFTCNMGDKEQTSITNEPGFARLADGEGSFRAIVYDDKNEITLKEISFFGHTTVGGIRRESDDSVTRLELSKIKEIKILKSHFDSKRFGDKDFTLVEILATTGAAMNDLLVPKRLIMCGIDEKTGLEKSWFLHKVNRVVMQGPTPIEIPKIASVIAQPIEAITTQQTVVSQAPTIGSQEKTKRTFRRNEVNKWDKFYEQNQLPQSEAEGKVEKREGIGAAFIAIIDAILDFVKALINSAIKFFK